LTWAHGVRGRGRAIEGRGEDHSVVTSFDPVAVFVPSGQGWKQIGELALALGLSSLIGLEREWRQKSAGLRTHTLVGVGAALFLLVSKYGFSDVLGSHVILDPSRVAAQIVTGIGFIGGGLIFVRADAVRGLTTAAIVWVTAAVGMACGAGVPLLALVVTAGHFTVVFLFPYLEARLPRSRYLGSGLRVVYADGRGLLREILDESARLGFSVVRLDTHQLDQDVRGARAVAVNLTLQGEPPQRASPRHCTTLTECSRSPPRVTSRVAARERCEREINCWRPRSGDCWSAHCGVTRSSTVESAWTVAVRFAVLVER
jgi:putative Mg2+ transporter-C (MgtC) family protein